MDIENSKYGSVQRGLIAEDLLKFSWADEITLSPNGQTVAYTVKQPHADSNGYISRVYLRSVNSSEGQCLTPEVGVASAIAWSKDGNRLAYSWRSVEADVVGSAVHIYSIETEEEEIFEVDGEPISSLDWSAGGDRLVGVRWTPVANPDDRGPRNGVPKPAIKVVRRLRYKQDGVGWVHDRFLQIWVLELNSGALRQITHSECDYAEPKWSNNGERLAFIGVAREQNTELGQGQIFICDHPGGAPFRLLPDWVGKCHSPVWGEDDKYIAFAGHTHPAPTNRRIFMTPYLADVEKQTAHELAPGLDQEVGNYGVADQRPSLTNVTLKWPSGDPWIYFLLTEQAATNLYRIDVKGKKELLIKGEQVVFEYSPAAGGTVAYGLADPSSPGDIYMWEQGNSSCLTDINPWLRDHWLATPEMYWFDAGQGEKVHAWLMKPPGFDEKRKYPLVLYVHCSMFSWDFNHEFQSLANAGYLVAYFNAIGSTAGYGQAWTVASEGDQGGRDYEQTMVGVDELIARGYVDEKRMGVTGGSCGGYMTNWIVGHNDRFAAAVAQRSIANNISFFGTSDIGPECTSNETGEDPWSNLEQVWSQSPIAYAEDMHTPLLIVHSDEDHRCPLEQAEQLFAVLRWMGREVELVIFEGENHGLSRGGRPGNRIERLRRISGWFDKHLGTKPSE